ncbi:MAG: stage II sporulation protein M [Candidatus Woesearchaeota archaeon]|jgi:uncharacterized membrane protein SpoIIM required for sporulation|nr:stage II sporulation protein M [Candidatus Woesearchaeota archaeon]
MLEEILFDSEKENNFLKISFITIIITITLGMLNYFLGQISFLLVSLVSLALSYPLISYIKKIDRDTIDEFQNKKNIFKRYNKELVVFWSIFIGAIIGFYILNSTGLTNDFTYEESFISSTSGMITQTTLDFITIFTNNLKVALFTFIISFIVFSGLIFVLVWNASIVAYYLFTFSSYKQALFTGLTILAHGLLEIGGYIFIGLAGGILAHRLNLAYKSKNYTLKNKDSSKDIKKDRRNTFKKIVNKRLFLDLSYLIIIGITFIFIAATLEVL